MCYLRLFGTDDCDLVTVFVFFFNDTATTEIYTLSLHDALPIYSCSFQYSLVAFLLVYIDLRLTCTAQNLQVVNMSRSEEHTSELQSRLHLVCRLLLEKKKFTNPITVLIVENTLY